MLKLVIGLHGSLFPTDPVQFKATVTTDVTLQYCECSPYVRPSVTLVHLAAEVVARNKMSFGRNIHVSLC